jgi:ribonuclease P protein component
METHELSGTLQIAFSVPKRKLKFAHQRNIVKRRLRNSYRLNKTTIFETLKAQNRSLVCLLVYSESQILPYALLDEKINLVIHRIQEQLFVTLDHHSKEIETK